jgi:3-oxoacyl-[acyl-carrier protein] reductase
MNMNDAVVVITGGRSGYGEGMAHAFAKQGAKVAIIDLSGDQARRVVADLPHDSYMAIEADVSNGEAVRGGSVGHNKSPGSTHCRD